MIAPIEKGKCPPLPLRWNGKKFYTPELHKAIAKLSIQEKIALHLRYWENYSIMQIAQHWRICWDTADKLVTRAEAKIRNEFIEQYKLSRIEDIDGPPFNRGLPTKGINL